MGPLANRILLLVPAVALVLLMPWCRACSPPQGWAWQSPDERLDTAALVVNATVKNIRHDVIPRTIMVDIEVQCVLKNTGGVRVPGELSVAQPWPPRCVNHIWQVAPGDSALMMLRAPRRRTMADVYEFHMINVQGAILDIAETSDPSWMKRCDFKDAELPKKPSPGAQCQNPIQPCEIK